MKEEIKEAGQKALLSLIILTIEEVSKGINEKVKSYINTVFANIKERDAKYNECQKIAYPTSSELNKLSHIEKAIIESKLMSELILSERDLLSKNNPIDLIKNKYLAKEHYRWVSLNLCLVAAKRANVQYEVKKIYSSKKDINSFFDGYPNIVDEILKIDNNTQLKELIAGINSSDTMLKQG